MTNGIKKLQKPRIYVLETGGTIAQKKTVIAKGISAHRPIQDSVVKKVKGVNKLADVKVELLPKLIDSTNMLTHQRIMLAKKLYANHRHFDGFVILHGTDTMAETAAFLTFALRCFGKPIILTGSQRSIYEDRTDAKNNILAAIESSTQDYGEVVICFGGQVLRGSRALKYDEEGNDAFESPRCPPIGKIGLSVTPLGGRINRFSGDPVLFTDFDTGISFEYPASGASIDIFSSTIKNRNVHGIVFVGFGAGNIPESYYPALASARELNKPVVVVTECPRGKTDMGIYEPGVKPLELGVIPGADMTPKVAAQKLMFALGRATADNIASIDKIEYVRHRIHTPYAREISLEGVML